MQFSSKAHCTKSCMLGEFIDHCNELLRYKTPYRRLISTILILSICIIWGQRGEPEQDNYKNPVHTGEGIAAIALLKISTLLKPSKSPFMALQHGENWKRMNGCDNTAA